MSTIAPTCLIDGIHHVSLPVKDLNISKDFYSKLFGLQEMPRPDSVFNFKGAWYELPNGQQLHLVFNPNGTYLDEYHLNRYREHLYEYRRDKLQIQIRPDVHFAFKVSRESFHKIFFYLVNLKGSEHEIPFVEQPYQDRFKQLYIFDPNNHTIEVTSDF